MIKAHKKVIIAKQGNYRIKLVNNRLVKNNVFKPADSGLVDVMTRFCNHLDEQVIVINEYEEIMVIKNNGNKTYKELDIIFTHSKLPISNKQDHEDCNISLTMEDFDDFGCVYIPELNIVVALAKSYETYKIKHPYSVHTHRDILKSAVEELKEEMTNIALLWYVNEPDKSNSNYYLGMGQDVVPLHKTHHPDSCISFVMISPESQDPSSLDYSTQLFDISNMKDEEVREITYSFGKNKYVLYISKNLNQLYKDKEKRQKEKQTKRYVGKSEYEEAIEKLQSDYKQQLETELLRLKNEKDEIISQLEEKIALQQKNIDTMEDMLNKYKDINDMFDERHKRDSNRYTYRAKVHTAENNAKKERMALFNDLIKYGIGGLITLVTLLTAQKMKK